MADIDSDIANGHVENGNGVEDHSSDNNDADMSPAEEVEKPKRGRGRPPKAGGAKAKPVAKGAVSPARKRGRPAAAARKASPVKKKAVKEASDDEEEAYVSADDSGDDKPAPAAAKTEAKRGRGRPSKGSKSPAKPKAKAVAKPAASGAKRGRGRPKKNASPVDEASGDDQKSGSESDN